MNQIQLQELYNEYIGQANACFDRAMNPEILAAGLNDGWELGSQSYEHSAFMLYRKCMSIGIVLTTMTTNRQKEIDAANMESCAEHEGIKIEDEE